MDQLARNAAYETAGTVISIPAHSLARTLKPPGVRRALHAGRAVICSPYAPASPFSVGQAMGRNKLIYALSDVTVAIAADEGSGCTWSGATEAMKGRCCPVAVWRGPGEGPGNEALADMGAILITHASQLQNILNSPQSENEESPLPEMPALFNRLVRIPHQPHPSLSWGLPAVPLAAYSRMTAKALTRYCGN